MHIGTQDKNRIRCHQRPDHVPNFSAKSLPIEGGRRLCHRNTNLGTIWRCVCAVNQIHQIVIFFHAHAWSKSDKSRRWIALTLSIVECRHFRTKANRLTSFAEDVFTLHQIRVLHLDYAYQWHLHFCGFKSEISTHRETHVRLHGRRGPGLSRGLLRASSGLPKHPNWERIRDFASRFFKILFACSLSARLVRLSLPASKKFNSCDTICDCLSVGTNNIHNLLTKRAKSLTRHQILEQPFEDTSFCTILKPRFIERR